MRVTQGMMVGNFLNNLNNNFRTMDKIQEQLSTGRRINRASDDPVGVVSSLRLRTGLTETEKYLSNVDDGKAWLETTDIALGQAGNILHRVRELTVQGANDTLPPQSLDAIAKEVAQLREQLIQVGNSTVDGRFIFGGYQTTNPPFIVSGLYGGDPAIIYNGDNGTINYEIGVNIQVPINITGDSPFTSIMNIFDLLTDIKNDIAAGNTGSLSSVRLGQLDSVMDNMLSVRSDVGAKVNRMEMTKARLDDTNLNLSALLSKNEDIDTAKVITELKMQENTYQTALAAGARIIQPTLMDFLR
ncbi:MAG: flagellar hook-associated protein FlgL [Firmicutes bacterium HGW-Firmicutes-8]|nr:MAG: flagellar hook-associated protein FlgL [Firmicutes bacterium HGW-Firmicutes-8]